MKEKKRYQDCNWFVKLIRNVWFLSIPFIAIYYYLTNKRIYRDEIVDGKLVHTDKFEIMSWVMCWRIARGEIDSKRGHYYTHDEVMKKLKEKIKREK